MEGATGFRDLRLFSEMQDTSESDRRLFYNLKRDDHPLNSLLPRYKDCIVNLRRKSIVRPSINTERFKDSFFNRLIFKYNLAV